MAKTVEFIKEDQVNGETYKKGDKLSVSSSIYESLKKKGTIKVSKDEE